MSFEDTIQVISVFFVIFLILYILFRNDFSLDEIDGVAIAIAFFLSVYAGVELYRLFSHTEKKSPVICNGKIYGPQEYEIKNGFLVTKHGDKYRLDGGTCEFFSRSESDIK